MARKSYHVSKFVPGPFVGLLALGKEDALAYYSKAPAAGCNLRDIGAIEQMFGYYSAE